MARHAGSLTGGGGDRLARFFRRLSARWYRVIDLIPIRWRRFTDRVRFRWYAFVHGLGRGWDRIAHGPERSDHRAARWPVIATAVALVIALLGIGVLLAFARMDRTQTPPPVATVLAPPRGVGVGGSIGQDVISADDQLPGINVHVNDQAGYLFSYPDGWTLSRAAESSSLRSPDGDVLMSFGMAPSGSLEQTSDRVVGNLTSKYTDVKVLSEKSERTEQGQASLLIGGTASDTTGSSVRFLVITIRGQDRNWAITVHYAAGANPVASLPAIEEIVGSFRTSRPA